MNSRKISSSTDAFIRCSHRPLPFLSIAAAFLFNNSRRRRTLLRDENLPRLVVLSLHSTTPFELRTGSANQLRRCWHPTDLPIVGRASESFADGRRGRARILEVLDGVVITLPFSSRHSGQPRREKEQRLCGNLVHGVKGLPAPRSMNSHGERGGGA